MPMYLSILLMACLGAIFPVDASAISLFHSSAGSSLSCLPGHGDAPPATNVCPVMDHEGYLVGGSLSEDPAGDLNQFLFLDLHTDIEPYYPPDNAQPGLLLLIGTSMIVLALFGRRMIH